MKWAVSLHNNATNPYKSITYSFLHRFEKAVLSKGLQKHP